MKRSEFLCLLLGSPILGQQPPPPQTTGADSRAIRVKPVNATEKNVPGVGPAPSGHRRALCIGNNAYRFAVPLRNATPDATDIAALLKQYRFETTLLTDGPLADTQDAIRKFVDGTGTGDSVLFFYAGHGFQLEGGNFLVPIDFHARDEDSAKASAIQTEAILEGFVRKRAHLTVMMLDACRNNPFRESAPAGLAPSAPVLGTLAMYATAAGKTADDNPQGHNGLFTSKLLKAFGAGLPLQTLVRKVRDDVFQASGGRQRPYVQEDLVGDFQFTAPPPGADQPAPSRGSADALLAEGLTAYRSADFAGAFAAFGKVVKIDPANVYAWNAAGAALAQLGRKSEAVEWYGHAIETNPAYVAAYVNRGLAYLSEARYPQAIQDFSWAVEEDSSNPLLYKWRGQAYLGIRNYQEGLADLNHALDLDSGSPEAYLLRGRLHRRLGQNIEALSDCNRALQLKRSFWQALEERAAVHRALGQSGNAAADDKAAADLKPRLP